MIDINKAQHFAAALTDLCITHGVMIRPAASLYPILATAVIPDIEFHYMAEVMAGGNSIVIRRVLEKRP